MVTPNVSMFSTLITPLNDSRNDLVNPRLFAELCPFTPCWSSLFPVRLVLTCCCSQRCYRSHSVGSLCDCSRSFLTFGLQRLDCSCDHFRHHSYVRWIHLVCSSARRRRKLQLRTFFSLAFDVESIVNILCHNRTMPDNSGPSLESNQHRPFLHFSFLASFPHSHRCPSHLTLGHILRRAGFFFIHPVPYCKTASQFIYPLFSIFPLLLRIRLVSTR